MNNQYTLTLTYPKTPEFFFEISHALKNAGISFIKQEGRQLAYTVTDTQPPDFGEGVELGGRVWYPMKLLHISSNVFAGTEMLSLSVYEPIAIQLLLGGGPPPIWSLGRARAGCGTP